MTDQIENTEVNAENAPIETTNETVNETGFLDQITDEEIKGSKSLSNFKDINGLAKSYINLEKKLGAPKEPESYAPDDYTYELPENYQANDDLLNLVKDKSNAVINPSQIILKDDLNKVGLFKAEVNFHAEVKANISIKIDKIQSK